MDNITPAIVNEFKERMHITHGGEDDNLKRILSASDVALRNACGNYDIKVDEDYKELVFERSRYVYNDALEYFNVNFQSQINTLGISKALEEIEVGDINATI